MKTETRNFVDGSVEVDVARDDGEVIASVRVRLAGRREEDGAESYSVQCGIREDGPKAPFVVSRTEHSWLPVPD